MATVWAVGWMSACLLLGWMGLVVAAATAEQHHLDGAADLAALSAAARLQHSGGGTCAVAATVAAHNQARLAGCRVDGSDVVVRLTKRLDLGFGLHPWIEGQARAGPG